MSTADDSVTKEEAERLFKQLEESSRRRGLAEGFAAAILVVRRFYEEVKDQGSREEQTIKAHLLIALSTRLLAAMNEATK